MLRHFLVLTCATLTAPCFAQKPGVSLAEILSFEAAPNGHQPGGWGGGPSETIWLDSDIVHGGRHSVRLERNVASANGFSTITSMLPMDFAGKRVELRGFLKTENVSEYAGLWMRQDGETPNLEFDNMQARHLHGTTDWAVYSIVLPVHPKARRLFFGVLIAGTGKAWADDLQLLVDGKPVWDAPKIEIPKTILDTDHEFDGGSGIVLTQLTKVQIDNLALLGKVWGFLKYHHPLVASGQKHWDYELFRVLPAILAAPGRAAANAAMVHWIGGLGLTQPCAPCAALAENDIHIRPALDWLLDEALLGEELGLTLRSIYRNRPAGGKQFYVSMMPGVGNPSFEHELTYQNIRFPDAGFELLSVYRFWNIIEYWYPYRDILGEDWDQVLTDAIPNVALAKDRDAYQLKLIALIARVHDTHANLWSSIAVRPPTGACQVPVNVRFVENRAVIVSYAMKDESVATGLKVGDEITSIDGAPVSTLIREWTPYYADSNDAARLRDMGRSLTRGDCGASAIGVHRESDDTVLKTARLPVQGMNLERTHDLVGDTFRVLPEGVAYLKLSSVKTADAAHYVEEASKAKGLVIDIRNYPSEFVVFALGTLLVDRETPFVRFTGGDLANPGAFHWGSSISLMPAKPHFTGKIAILVDETSQSQAEYTAMALRSAPGAVVVGSTTAGADGNVSQIPLPGGLSSMISGIGVFYPDKRPTQRIGIVPDVEVKPTIAGIREGRDEVLEAAIRKIL